MDSVTTVPRATALVLVLLTRLQQRWRVQSDLQALELQLLTAGVSAAPSAVFAAETTAVEVRAIEIGDKLFVHFVSPQTAVRLDLVLSEYVKPAGADSDASLDRRQHTRVKQWVVLHELLQWRLERNVYPDFAATGDRGHASASADAELGRLPEPLLLQLAPFLSAVDFCGVTQTNQFLRQFANNQEIWSEYVKHDFPTAPGSTTAGAGTPKESYVAHHTRAKRLRDTRRSMVQSGLMHEGEDFFDPPRIFIPPGLRQPGLIPPPFVGQWRPPNGGHARPHDW